MTEHGACPERHLFAQDGQKRPFAPDLNRRRLWVSACRLGYGRNWRKAVINNLTAMSGRCTRGETKTMFGSTLICDYDFTGMNRTTRNMSDYYFKNCVFNKLEFEGGDFGTLMVFCELRNCDLYWSNMSSGLFVSTRFFDTAFRGIIFAGSKFIECSFVDCNFGKDNLDGDCDFADAKFIDCEFQNTVGAPTVT
jgi:hypothetical protein